MTYEEFEWHILRLVYEERLETLQPSFLAYALGLPHETVTTYLEHATHAGLVEMDITEEGRIEYFVPGLDLSTQLPTPVWKKEFETASSSSATVDVDLDGVVSDAPSPDAAAPHAPDGTVGGEPVQDPRDGVVSGHGHGRRTHPYDTSKIPSSLRQHIEHRYAGTDGALVPYADPVRVVEGEARVEEVAAPVAMVAIDEDSYYHQGGALALRVESNEEAFCDPSRTMFMRQIRVYGSQSPADLREQVSRLFQSLGYRMVDTQTDRMRFERGSVMFILALVPLFVLVLPLFIYLFLYCMGRSTIQQEPLELDVQFRQRKGHEPFWEIDLTFIGLHGVVLGAADQQVLNREIDTLRDELRWALTGT